MEFFCRRRWAPAIGQIWCFPGTAKIDIPRACTESFKICLNIGLEILFLITSTKELLPVGTYCFRRAPSCYWCCLLLAETPKTTWRSLCSTFLTMKVFFVRVHLKSLKAHLVKKVVSFTNQLLPCKRGKKSRLISAVFWGRTEFWKRHFHSTANWQFFLGLKIFYFIVPFKVRPSIIVICFIFNSFKYIVLTM